MTEEEKLRDGLLHGNCYPACMVLAEELGWPICGLLVDVPGCFREWIPHPVHAFVLSPDGGVFDAGGFRTKEDVIDHYLSNTVRKFRSPRFVEFGTSEEFRAALRPLYMGGEVPEGVRTDYDDLLDEVLPCVRGAVEKLGLVEFARSEFPEVRLSA